MKTWFIKLLVISLICAAYFIFVYPKANEWIQWKRQQAFVHTIIPWCSHNKQADEDWRRYCTFMSFCTTSCYDKICNKNKHLAFASALAEKICNNPTAKANILQQGLLENTLNLYQHSGTTALKDADLREFNSWISEQNRKMAETGEKIYLFQDHDYMTQLDNISQGVLHSLTPTFVSEEENKAIYTLNDKDKKNFFYNNEIPSPHGDGMCIEAPLDLRNTGNECINILQRYIHDVLKATTIRIINDDGTNNALYKVILYDKNSKKSFFLYILADEKQIEKYTVL